MMENNLHHARLILSIIFLASASLGASPEVFSQTTSQAETEILGLQERSIAAYETKDFDEAFRLSDEALERTAALFGVQSQEYFVFLNLRSEMLKPLQKWQEMADNGAQLIPLARKYVGSESLEFLSGLSEYASVLEIVGKPQDAEPLHAEIYQTSVKLLGKNHTDALQAQYNYAEILYSLGKFAGATKLADQAFDARRNTLGEGHESSMRSMNQVGRIALGSGDYKRAEQLFSDLIKVRTSVSGASHPETAAATNNLAIVMDNSGRYFEAEPLYGQALLLAQKAYGDKHPAYLTALNNYANIQHALGRSMEAEALYKKGLQQSEQLLGKEHPDTLFKMSNLGLFYLELNRLSEAEPLVTEALESRKRVLGENSPDTLQSLGIFAGLMERLGQNEKAEAAYLEELSGKKAVLGGQHPSIVSSLNNLGTFYVKTGQGTKGAPLLVEALELSVHLQGKEHLETIRIANSIAYVMLKTGDSVDLSFEPADLAVSGLRTRRKAMGSDPRAEAQLARQRSSERSFFADLVDAAWMAQLKGDDRRDLLTEKAYAAAQDILSGSASKALAQSAARSLAQQQADLGDIVRERESLSDQWVQTEQAINVLHAKSGDTVVQDRDKLLVKKARTEKRLAEIDGTLRREAPQYFTLISPEPIDIAESKKLFRSDEAGLIIIPTEFGTHVMAISEDGLKWHRSDWTRSQIDAATTRLLWDVGANVEVPIAQSLEWQEQGDGAYPFDFETAYSLYREIVEPVTSVLDGKTHLFVMTSGSLASLPLGILVSEVPVGPNGDPKVLRSAKWLADQFALITAPNIQSIRFLRSASMSKNSKRQSPFLGFGNPILSDTAQLRGSRGAKNGGQKGYRNLFSQQQSRSGAMIADVKQLKNMASLPGTAKELTAMWEAFGRPKNSLFLDAKATETEIRSTTLSADIIAFATHGLMAAEIGSIGEPGLVLTPPANATSDNDGYLSMSEVAALKMDTDWVILSACNTAAGDGSETASGLSGLARSFFFAGARKLLASNWPVRDDVSALLTVNTIKIARDNPELSQAQAFQRAMQEIRNDESADSETDSWAHPNAWAPFILIGDR
jgi:CHAT domain-containing protein